MSHQPSTPSGNDIALATRTQGAFIETIGGDRVRMTFMLPRGAGRAEFSETSSDPIYRQAMEAMQARGLNVVSAFDGGRGYVRSTDDPARVEVIGGDVVEGRAQGNRTLRDFFTPRSNSPASLNQGELDRAAIELGYDPGERHSIALSIRGNPGESARALGERALGAYREIKEDVNLHLLQDIRLPNVTRGESVTVTTPPPQTPDVPEGPEIRGRSK